MSSDRNYMTKEKMTSFQNISSSICTIRRLAVQKRFVDKYDYCDMSRRNAIATENDDTT